MEVLVHWPCRCPATSKWCAQCEGKGYLDRWLPLDTLRFLTEGTFLIFGCRQIAGIRVHAPERVHFGLEERDMI